MFDLKKVVRQIEQGNYPSNWLVYRIQHKNAPAIAHWAVVVVIGIMELCFLNGGIIAFLIPLPILLLFIWKAIKTTRKGSANKHFSMLAILPVGVVQHYGYDSQEISWLYFPNIIRIEIAGETEIRGFDGDIETRTHYWLDIYGKDGAYSQWWINECFGNTAAIGKSIIAAYEYYQHNP